MQKLYSVQWPNLKKTDSPYSKHLLKYLECTWAVFVVKGSCDNAIYVTTVFFFIYDKTSPLISSFQKMNLFIFWHLKWEE